MRFVGHFGDITTDEYGNRKCVDYLYYIESEELEEIIENGKAGDKEAEKKALMHIRDCNQLERYLEYVADCANNGNELAQGLIKWRKDRLRKGRNEKIFNVLLILALIAIIIGIGLFIKWLFF